MSHLISSKAQPCQVLPRPGYSPADPTGKEKGQSHLLQMTQPQGEIELWLKAFSVIIPAPPPRNWENQVSPLPCSPHVAEWGEIWQSCGQNILLFPHSSSTPLAGTL